MFRFCVATFRTKTVHRSLISIYNIDLPLVNLVVNQGHAVQFRKDQVLLLKDERRHVPVVKLVRVQRLRADPCNFVRSQHQSHDFLAKFELVTLATNFINQILLLLVMLPVQVLYLTIMVLIFVPESCYNLTLCFNLGLQIAIGLLDHKNFFFFVLLLLE